MILKECRSSNEIYLPYFPGLMHVSASAYIKVILHTHCLSQPRNLLSIYICLIPGKRVHQIGCSRKPFLNQTTFYSNYQMDFCHSRRDGCVCQNNAQQSFIARCPTTEITELHKTWRNCDFLLDHLGKKTIIISMPRKMQNCNGKKLIILHFTIVMWTQQHWNNWIYFSNAIVRHMRKYPTSDTAWSTYWMTGCLFDKEPLPVMLYSYLLGSKYCIRAHILIYKLYSSTFITWFT